MPRMASSVHDGVSCDSCLKSNFPGDRFKCLRCYDFDLCRECYESSRFGGNGSEHTADHPVQCIMTQEDFEMAYWGETGVAFEEGRVIVFTCPHCGQNGFNQTELYEHVTQEHSELISSYEVICPACLASSIVDPNRMTDDLAAHLASEHIVRQDRPRDDDGSGRSGAGAPRRQFHPRQMGRRGRPMSSQHIPPTGRSANANGDASSGVDPIAELLTQLGGIRRASSNYSTTLAQIQQLQQQIGRRSGPRRVEGGSGGRSSQQSSGGRLMGPFDTAAFNQSYESDPLRAGGPVGDVGMVHLWSELVGNAGVPLDSAALTQMLRVAPPSSATAATTTTTTSTLKPTTSGAVRDADQAGQMGALTVASPVTPDTGDYWDDARYLTPRLFSEEMTESERREELNFLADRSEFVSELFLAMSLADDAELAVGDVEQPPVEDAS